MEPFHQSSIISSRQKRGREEEREEAREEEDRTGNTNKKTKLSNGKNYLRWSFTRFLTQITDIIMHIMSWPDLLTEAVGVICTIYNL